MGREASQVLSPPQLSCESSAIADAHRIRDEFFNTIGRILPQELCGKVPKAAGRPFQIADVQTGQVGVVPFRWTNSRHELRQRSGLAADRADHLLGVAP
jgi:hypothetical protein